MKNFSIYIFAIVLLATACKPHDEKRDALRAEMSAFEKDWAATGEMLTNWGLELDNNLKGLKNDSTGIVPDSIKNGCAGLKTEYDSVVYQWGLKEKSYGDWKKMFEDDLVKTSDGLRSLREFKDQLEKFNTQLENWAVKLENCNPKLSKARAKADFKLITISPRNWAVA